MGNRGKFAAWCYLGILGFLILPGIGYELARFAPIAVSQIWEIVAFSFLVYLFWILDLRIFIGGITASMETSPWLLLVLFLLSGPSIAFVAFFLGTSIYTIFFLRRPSVAKAATVSIGAFSYGFSFLCARFVFPSGELAPPWLFAEMAFILACQTVLYLLTGAGFVSLSGGTNYRKVLASFAPLSTLFLAGVTIVVFPSLAYISVVLWLAGLYIQAVLLFVPFLLLRRATQNALKAVEEIVNTIDAIVIVIEAKDPYTHYHCNRVALYARVIAKFCGFDDPRIESIGRAARLHDVGKVMVPDRALKKEGGLTEEEYAQIKLHADPNKVLMNQIPDGTPLKQLIEIGRHHHERYDGKGYPDQLAGEAIPVEVRVISVADAWDAMTSDRVYRKGLSEEKALSEIESYKGRQWDPLVVEAFQEAHAQGAIRGIVSDPDFLKSSSASWKIHPKPLRYLPPRDSGNSSKGSKAFSWRSLGFGLSLLILFLFLYLVHASPLYHDGILFTAALAVVLEFCEVKFPKLPRFSPVESVYLVSLFLLPWEGVAGLVLFGTLIRSLYDRKIDRARGRELLQRLFLFGFSIPYFRWLGFQSQGRLLIPEEMFHQTFGSLLLLSVLMEWGIFYSMLKFMMFRIETLTARRFSTISWHFATLKHLIFFELGLVAPFSFILFAFHAVDAIHFDYLITAFALVVVLCYPLLDYFRGVVIGNAKTLEALACATDERFAFYRGHTNRVVDLSKKMAVILGMSDEEIETLELAGRIFGLGNVGIPDEILNKPDSLTDEETRVMKQHVEISGQIAAQYSFYKEEVPIIWGHHERWDGQGYPSRLKEKALPLGARIIAVSDAYHAMISERPYRQPLSPERAVEQIERAAGTQFDPRVVTAFLKAVRLEC